MKYAPPPWHAEDCQNRENERAQNMKEKTRRLTNIIDSVEDRCQHVKAALEKAIQRAGDESDAMFLFAIARLTDIHRVLEEIPQTVKSSGGNQSNHGGR